MLQDKNFQYQTIRKELKITGNSDAWAYDNGFLPTAIPIFSEGYGGFSNMVRVEVGVNGNDTVDYFFAYLKLDFSDTGESSDRLFFNPIFENDKLVGVEILAQSLGAGCLIKALEFATEKMRSEITKAGAEDALIAD